jgi:hypothetical protein
MAQPTVYAWSRLGLDVKTDQGNAGDIRIEAFTGVTLIGKLTVLSGGTTPSVAYAIDYKLSDGTYVQAGTSAAFTAISTAVANYALISIGPGLLLPHVSGVIIRVRWTVVGAPTTATGDFHLLGENDY